MDGVTIEATAEGQARAMHFVEERAIRWHCAQKTIRHLLIVCDEVLSNIVKFAYPETTGEAFVELGLVVERNDGWAVADGDKTEPLGFEVLPRFLLLRFVDAGIPFNPLRAEEPDVFLPLDERPVGKLGLKIVRDLSQSTEYEYSEGRNILSVIV
ncbi:MAG: ATP-binding protein [Gordonibacter sp.]|nr:ATP-binding protein [Gordonibacter sp.]